MLIELLASIVLAAPGGERIIEPSSEADRVAKVAYFDSLVKLGALRPCQDLFRSHARTFAEAHATWTDRNARRISDGKKSIANTVGPEAANEPFPLDEAQAAMVTVLSGLPEARRLPWCQEHFPASSGRAPLAPADSARAARPDAARASFEAGVFELQDDDASNDAQALERIVTAADQGHPNAEALMAMMHLEGSTRFDMSPDIAQGLRYLKRAAEHGLNHAQLKLGMHYSTGDIVPQNPRLAEKWLTLGALQSDANMHAAMADMLEKGEGVPRSLRKAFRFYSGAADMGHAWAAEKAASMLLEGRGTPRDPSRAYYYALLAGQGGSTDAASLLKDASTRLGAAERKRIEARVKNWVPRSPHPSASLPLLPERAED